MTADPTTAPVPVPKATVEEPTVSIVITCYNYGRYLAEAVESALAQTRPADEIVIVDDGSTDNSLEVARRYAHLGQVRIVGQANQGAVAACNNGIRASRGTFFLRLDADDMLDPHYLELTVPTLANTPAAGYVYTGYRYFGARTEIVPALSFSARRLLLRPYILGTTLIRRAAFERVGGYSYELKSAYEDWDFYLALLEQGWPGIPVSGALYQYRQHAGSRNAMSFRQWLKLMGLLYRRHPSMRAAPLPMFIAQAIADRGLRRLRDAPWRAGWRGSRDRIP